MKKFYCRLAALALSLGYLNANSQDYTAQIDALQNELLKMKQEMNKGTNNKAFFKKGKGLSIESSDGKYSFQIKGRAMYDISHIDGMTNDSSVGHANKFDSFGAEF